MVLAGWEKPGGHSPHFIKVNLLVIAIMEQSMLQRNNVRPEVDFSNASGTHHHPHQRLLEYGIVQGLECYKWQAS